MIYLKVNLQNSIQDVIDNKNKQLVSGIYFLNEVFGSTFKLALNNQLWLTLENEKELNIRLNANTGEWDFDLLKEFNIETLTDIGFDPDILANAWDKNILEKEEDFNEEKELKEIKLKFFTGSSSFLMVMIMSGG